ncbi:MAG: glutamine synthetase III [Eubacteriales bacterium]|nr:glutamine synthetase III [Christensenellaceae bacterium]MDD7092476.1 glutamine synthetase III [Christensenellaceae bacterium]MDD7245319.1 glutamine synthetase III [Christensenellaceae bacterium]MDY2750851.1 glutamine synthetase III [Eubacteriales bacterium]MDY3241115.1 glutamine synthetase III [Eubacteriales bacterium]
MADYERMSIKDIFAEEVFTDEVMRRYMSEDAYRALKDVIARGDELPRSIADEVASAMKTWAVEKGATHYTHWFQPLTEYTAEKHDSFISVDKEGKVILDFSGKSLSKGEADASSFPSGGIRATFEARGYTVWDCSSPAFIKRSKGGAGVLCIPTAFCAYTGEALDKKTPLLRSMNVLNREVLRLLRLLGDKDTKKVTPVVGGEQEYFLIDKNHYMQREDLKYAGRTLFGAPPAKGQEKSDQYYATIRDRVAYFMEDLNKELWKLGITAKTEHNEVAPAQHELAPIYSGVNIATDQNQLIMETMKKVAEKHDLACLLHEKPFNGVNGSGKHNNWSIITDTGVNLLEPGSNPSENRIFLLMILAVIAGVDEYADLVRMSASSAGNDNRLGGNEAPPSIVSVFVGDDLESAFETLKEGRSAVTKVKEYIKMGLPAFPKLKKDNTDRNRTSPFAFTGNKFEFRMVGSSASLATSNIVLNTITAETVRRISDEIEEKIKTNDLDHVVSEIIVDLIKKHDRVIYNGNNYSKEWIEEAKRRGLHMTNNSLDAYKCLLDPEIVGLYERNGILTEKELASRYEIFVDNYTKTINIEALAMRNIARKQILPAVMRSEGKMAAYLKDLRKIDANLGKAEEKIIRETDSLIVETEIRTTELERAIDKAKIIGDTVKKAECYRDCVLTAMNKLRESVDALELITEKKEWPFPSYGDMLFYE